VAGLAIFVLVTSVLDALLTLLHLQNGGTEVNPFMQLAILEGTGVFLAWKTWVTGLSGAFLDAVRRHAFRRPGDLNRATGGVGEVLRSPPERRSRADTGSDLMP
jgi:hypothetical protein